MIQKSLISVIIPTYNRAYLIRETLDSVLKQTYQNWECIIVDDGSTDNTREIIARYKAKDNRFHFYIRPPTTAKGAGACRNIGIKKCTGNFINFFDSDDLMDKTFLERKIEIFEKEPQLSIAFCAYHYFNEQGIQPRLGNLTFSGDIIRDLIEGNINFGPPSYLIKREVFDNLFFDETLHRAEDLDFFFKLFTKKNNLKIHHIAMPLFYVRKHSNNLSGKNDDNGLRVLSSFIVHRRISEHFFSIHNKAGFIKFTNKMLLNLRQLLQAKKIKIVVNAILRTKIFSNSKKITLLFYVLTYRISGKALYKIHKY